GPRFPCRVECARDDATSIATLPIGGLRQCRLLRKDRTARHARAGRLPPRGSSTRPAPREHRGVATTRGRTPPLAWWAGHDTDVWCERLGIHPRPADARPAVRTR